MRKKGVALFIAAVLGITSINMTAMASEPQEVFIEAEQTGSDSDHGRDTMITEVPDQTSDLQGQPGQEKENTTENLDDFSDTDKQAPSVTGITVEISLAIISRKMDSSRILNAYLRPDDIKCFLPVMEKSCQKNFLMK